MQQCCPKKCAMKLLARIIFLSLSLGCVSGQSPDIVPLTDLYSNENGTLCCNYTNILNVDFVNWYNGTEDEDNLMFQWLVGEGMFSSYNDWAYRTDGFAVGDLQCINILPVDFRDQRTYVCNVKTGVRVFQYIEVNAKPSEDDTDTSAQGCIVENSLQAVQCNVQNVKPADRASVKWAVNGEITNATKYDVSSPDSENFYQQTITAELAREWSVGDAAECLVLWDDVAVSELNVTLNIKGFCESEYNENYVLGAIIVDSFSIAFSLMLFAISLVVCCACCSAETKCVVILENFGSIAVTLGLITWIIFVSSIFPFAFYNGWIAPLTEMALASAVLFGIAGAFAIISTITAALVYHMKMRSQSPNKVSDSPVPEIPEKIRISSTSPSTGSSTPKTEL